MNAARAQTARRWLGGIAVAIVASIGSTAASAQELRQQFISPSFGGNPFNSDHLLAIANIHRPQAPAGATVGLSQQDLLVRQIQSRLLSALSSGLVEAVTGADPGTTGEFVIGDQRITFERTLTEIRLTFFNETTGETTEIVLPVFALTPAGMAGGASAGSPEAAISGGSSLIGGIGTLAGVPGGLTGTGSAGELRASSGELGEAGVN